MKISQRIISNSTILGGKPVIQGTRISVEFILELIASGMTVKEIVEEYPQLKSADIKAAIQCASKAVAKEYVFAA